MTAGGGDTTLRLGPGGDVLDWLSVGKLEFVLTSAGGVLLLLVTSCLKISTSHFSACHMASPAAGRNCGVTSGGGCCKACVSSVAALTTLLVRLIASSGAMCVIWNGVPTMVVSYLAGRSTSPSRCA